MIIKIMSAKKRHYPDYLRPVKTPVKRVRCSNRNKKSKESDRLDLKMTNKISNDLIRHYHIINFGCHLDRTEGHGLPLLKAQQIWTFFLLSCKMDLEKMESMTREGDYLAWRDKEWILHGQAKRNH